MKKNTSYNTVILENIRKGIITALERAGLLIGIDYKLSEVHENRPRFTMELLRTVSTEKVKSSMRYKFDRKPACNGGGSFIQMNFEKEYHYREVLNA